MHAPNPATRDARPVPAPDADSQPYWDAANREVFLFQRCTACSKPQFYARALCRHCHGRELAWEQAAGGGTIIDMVSGSARLDPIAPPGEGGWGILYSASKAAFGRVAGGVNAEYRAAGVRAFNVDPGNVVVTNIHDPAVLVEYWVRRTAVRFNPGTYLITLA